MLELFVWIGIAFCLSQSAIFSGLNLAFFSVSRLQLEAEARHSKSALRVLQMRKDANFLLTTILWGNVGINVLLSLLSSSVMAGVLAFLFSTVLITVFGEIGPQAYFSRHALRMASLLSPLLRLYQILLYPVARPSATLLDRWLGGERPDFYREHILRRMIASHVDSSRSADIEHVEGIGALNFLDIDDIMASEEGERLHPGSAIALPEAGGELVMPGFAAQRTDPFLAKLHAAGVSWIVFTNEQDEPRLVLNADRFLRDVLFEPVADIADYCHAPVIVRDGKTRLGDVIINMRRLDPAEGSNPLEEDVVLVWSDDVRRIITGEDLLGRLLFGIGDRGEARQVLDGQT